MTILDPVRNSRDKVLHYKTLVALLYGEQPWLEREGLRVAFQISPLARGLDVTISRLYGYIERLEDLQFIEDVSYPGKGRVECLLKLPRGV